MGGFASLDDERLADAEISPLLRATGTLRPLVLRPVE